MIEPMTESELEFQKEFEHFAARITCKDPMYAIQDASVMKSNDTGDLTYSITVRTRCRTPEALI